MMLEESAQGTGRRLGDSPPPPKAALDDLTDDEIREQLMARGLEVRRKRRPKSRIARPDDVAGKRRITVHLNQEMRVALQSASAAVNRIESNVTDEARRLDGQEQHPGGGVVNGRGRAAAAPRNSTRRAESARGQPKRAERAAERQQVFGDGQDGERAVGRVLGLQEADDGRKQRL